MVKFTEEVKEESERHIREGLTEDELELFDLLKKEKMTKDEEQAVKLAAKSLLRRLKEEQPKVLVQNWHLDNQSKKKVSKTVEEILNEKLPLSYNKELFREKRNIILDTMIDYASRGRKYNI